MTFNILFYSSIVILTGLIFGKIVKKFKLPNVTGYLIGGLIIGPSVMGKLGVAVLPEEAINGLMLLSEIALGFIAFSIGTEFKFSYFKRVGPKPIIIAIFESLFAVLFIFIVLILLGFDLGFSLVLSAIGAATAPAATLMVIKQYKAKGEVTETLMSVVAIDDATALIFFGIAVAIANNLKNTSANVFFTILKPFIEIVISLGIGFILGLIITFLLKWFTGRSNRISVVVAIVLLSVSINSIFKALNLDFEFSTLLAIMMIGAVFTNTSKSDQIETIMELVDRFTPPILISFFVISGAHLNLNVLKSVGLIGVVYIVMRVIGKVAGTWFGGVISKTSKKVQVYLGFSLIPQAGVAIGLATLAGSVVPNYAQQISAVILCATLIYELVGPMITKISLQKAGEISSTSKVA